MAHNARVDPTEPVRRLSLAGHSRPRHHRTRSCGGAAPRCPSSSPPVVAAARRRCSRSPSGSSSTCPFGRDNHVTHVHRGTAGAGAALRRPPTAGARRPARHRAGPAARSGTRRSRSPSTRVPVARRCRRCRLVFVGMLRSLDTASEPVGPAPAGWPPLARPRPRTWSPTWRVFADHRLRQRHWDSRACSCAPSRRAPSAPSSSPTWRWSLR